MNTSATASPGIWIKCTAVFVLPPYQTAAGASWYEGTANAIYQNIAFIERYDPEYVIVLGGDHIYKMDYSKMLDYPHCQWGGTHHRCHRCSPFRSLASASRPATNRKNHQTLPEKPRGPKSHTKLHGHLCFSWAKLKKYLIENENANTGSKDFPARTSFRQCWQNVTSVRL